MKSNFTLEGMPNLTGKVAIVTGANRGIGYETAAALAAKACTVILACRNEDKGKSALQKIVRTYPFAKVESIRLDLAALVSIHRFAMEFKRRHDRLDMLINNAAIMNVPFERTVDGFESQFAVNHLGHFALTGLLLERIIDTPRARVVTASSWGHRFGVIDIDNLNSEKRHDPDGAYARSKLANLLFTYELQRLFERAGVDAIATAVHPGWTATHLPDGWSSSKFRLDWWLIRMLNPILGQPPKMGALPTLYAATALDVRGGGYYGPGSWAGLRGHPKLLRSGGRSYDTELAVELWKASERLTGVKYDWFASSTERKRVKMGEALNIER